MIVVIVAVFLAGRHCGRQRTMDITKPETIPAEYRLTPDEVEKIVLDEAQHTAIIVTPKKIQTVELAHNAKVTVTVKKDGVVTVVTRPYGLTLEPGIGVAYGDVPGLTLDLEVAYWHNVNVLTGIRVLPKPTAYLAVGYCLSAIHMSNTSVFVGMGLGREILGGVRVSF